MNHQVLHFASPEAVVVCVHGWPGFITGPFVGARFDRMRMRLGVRDALVARDIKGGVGWTGYLCCPFGVGTAEAVSPMNRISSISPHGTVEPKRLLMSGPGRDAHA